MSKPQTYRKWSAEEVNFLHRNYGALTADEIADHLQRTADSIWEKAGREGLRKHAKRHQRSVDGPWHCPKCDKTKPQDEFYKNGSRRGSPYCIECTNKGQHKTRKDLRR